ncbi:MAG: restriction endonuclease subunit S [Treponema sp.]
MNLETDNKIQKKGITLVIPNSCGNIKETKMKNSGIEWIGEIPEDWEVKKVKHSFVRKNEKAMQENPIVLSLARTGVRERDISNNEGQLAESYYNYNPVDVDDLLINPMDLYSGANCSISKVKGVISPAYINLRAKKNVSPVFYDYYFKVQYWMMAFFAHGNGVSFENRWTLNNETLQNYPIVAPSFDTQQSIASYLDKKCSKIEETIQNQQQVIKKLKAYKQSLITEAVTGKVKIENGKTCSQYESYKDSGVEWIGKIPSEWEVKKLKYIADTFLKGSGITKEEIVINGDTPCVRYGELYTKYDYHFTECQTRTNLRIIETPKYFSYGDVLFTCTGELVDEIGKSIAYLGNEKCLAGGDIIVLKHSQNPMFMGFALDSKYVQGQKSFGKTKLKVVHISSGEIARLLIVLPPKEEQKEIADYLDKKCTAIDTAIEQKQELIECSAQSELGLFYKSQ